MGNLYLSPTRDKVLIYDKYDVLAGMHSIFPVTATDSQRYNYNKTGWYRQAKIKDIDYYVATAYFIHPYDFCFGDRMESTSTTIFISL